MNYLNRKILSTQKTIYIVIFLVFCYEIITSSVQFENIFNAKIINDQLGSEEKVDHKNIRENKIEIKNIDQIDPKILSGENLKFINTINFDKGEFNIEEKIIIEYIISHPELKRKRIIKEIKKIFKEKGIKKSKNQIESIINSLNKKNTLK